MATGKNKIIVYADWLDSFEELNDEELGKLMRHLFQYVNDMNPILEDRILKIAWKPIEATLKRDLEKWRNKTATNRANGALGGRPRKNPKKPNGYSENPKKPDSDSDSDSDSDINKIEVFSEEVINDDPILNWCFSNNELRTQWILWKKFKEKEFKFKYASEISEKVAISKLKNLAEDNPKRAIKIINESIANGWKGFFKLQQPIKEAPAAVSLAQKMRDDYAIN